MAPIKVHGRFATARDTARTLGVSPSRLNTLINTVKEFTYLAGDDKEATPDRFKRRERSSKARSGVFARKKSSRRNAEASVKKAKAKSSKVQR
jgi:hypothetical protein